MIARIAGTGKYIHEVILIAAFYGRAHLFKVVHYLIENNQYGVFVGQGYISPHYRIAGGDAGKVAKAAGGITEYFSVVAHGCKGID